jgi:hypothetical protein
MFTVTWNINGLCNAPRLRLRNCEEVVILLGINTHLKLHDLAYYYNEPTFVLRT